MYDYLQSGAIGCKARAERMTHIYNKLYERGKGTEFENFILDKFPYVIDRGSDVKPQLNPHKHMKAKISRPAVKHPKQKTNSENMNKHGVFRTYKPEILSFPQKRIIVNDDRKQLEAQVSSFIKDKFGVDHVIVEDRAYIEYFEARYKGVVEKVEKNKRDIYLYKKDHA